MEANRRRRKRKRINFWRSRRRSTVAWATWFAGFAIEHCVLIKKKKRRRRTMEILDGFLFWHSESTAANKKKREETGKRMGIIHVEVLLYERIGDDDRLINIKPGLYPFFGIIYNIAWVWDVSDKEVSRLLPRGKRLYVKCLSRYFNYTKQFTISQVSARDCASAINHECSA